MEHTQPTVGPSPRILFVDDELMLHDVIQRLLGRHGIDVQPCLRVEQAIEHLRTGAFDLVMTDFKMPDMDGFDLLAYLRTHHPDVRVIMLTGHASIQHAVQAMQHGAVDYVPKPFSTSALLERVLFHLEAARTAPAHEAAAPTKPRSRKAPRTEFVGQHASVVRLKEFLPRVARSKAPVFIHGESGTGKEILSRLVHDLSDRADGPFVAINCANLPRDLVESHLFGHRKGSFTGAIEHMDGAFTRADGGTLLLDEVTEINLDVQAKLLRVLQEQEIQPVGAPKPIRVDVRVVATSNRDLRKAVEQGQFREDLYHRLAVFPLFAPPLRERLDDVPLLAQRFIDKYCDLYGLPPKRLRPDLLHRMAQFTWPGNVRQLENFIHRGVVLAAERPEIEPADVMHDLLADTRPLPNDVINLMPAPAAVVAGPPAPAAPPGAAASAATIEEMERDMILRALAAHNNNQRLAAEQLGVSTRTIRNKLKRYREEGLPV